MIRTLGYIIAFAILAVVSVWLAGHSQPVTLKLFNYRLDTSLGMLLGIVAILAMVASRLWVFITRAPAKIVRAHNEARRQRGYKALTRGMVAVAAGDSVEAGRQVKRADVLLNEPPLTMLLSAQAAQLEGDEKAAAKFFKAMLEIPETEFLGLRGLFNQAVKKDDKDEALQLVRKANRLKPASKWVAKNLFELQTQASQWLEAEETLSVSVRKKLLSPAEGRRKRAVLCHQISMESNDPRKALKRARQAHDLDNGFIPAGEHLARLFAESGKVRKATGLIEKIWAHHPHPSLLDIYWSASKGDDAMAKLRATQRLARFNPDNKETHIALARAALGANIWGEARKHLNAVVGDDPESRVCRLMAELEEAENNDLEAARGWLIKASLADPDPAWVCDDCGNVSSEWSVLCTKCSGFDSLTWQTPAHAVSLSEPHRTDVLALAEGESG